MGDAMSGIEIRSVGKWFGTVPALGDIDLHVAPGEFMVLLGPSGCGKTTLLRCIAGVEQPTSGEVYLDGRQVFSREERIEVPPKDRDTGIVFQSYALYPHMTVFQNVSFGLRVRKFQKERIRRRVREALKLVELEGFEDRYPRHLSGGQQQRVAVARTIVAHPSFLLFDEPLANLDPMLRVSLRAHLKRLHRQMGSTSLYVTHDQGEAMVLADRIAVMQQGSIEQIGTPHEVYHFPATVAVADFTGNPKTNLIQGEIHDTGERILLVPDSDPYCFIALSEECRAFAGEEVVLHTRPEDVDIRTELSEDEGRVPVIVVMHEGAHTLVHMYLGEDTRQIIARYGQEQRPEVQRGQEVQLRFRRGNIYDPATGQLRGSFGYQAISGRPNASAASLEGKGVRGST
jgi:multiple sugar transport system ATP-binding protein